jgi:hypothetical protein
MLTRNLASEQWSLEPTQQNSTLVVPEAHPCQFDMGIDSKIESEKNCCVKHIEIAKW